MSVFQKIWCALFLLVTPILKFGLFALLPTTSYIHLIICVDYSTLG